MKMKTIKSISTNIFLCGALIFGVVSCNNKAENEYMEKQTCELGYGNYKCSTIKDGTVIVKRPMKEMDKLEKSEAEKKEEINANERRVTRKRQENDMKCK